MADPNLIFGYPHEWQSFRERNPLFLAKFPQLEKTLDAAFIRDFQTTEPIDRFVMMFGRLCLEDFFEIVLMCGNGYGMAASRLLRALWEKAVTLEYLEKHPHELDDFFEYHHVSQRKLLKSMLDILGENALPATMIAENEANFQRVKERFLVDACKQCGTKRVNHTWHKMDIVSMSKTTRLLGKLVNEGYYRTLSQTHSSVWSLIQRLEENDRGAIGFNPDSQRKAADDALRTSHLIMLEILAIQDGRYKLPGLAENIKKCEEDWFAIYIKTENKSI